MAFKIEVIAAVTKGKMVELEYKYGDKTYNRKLPKWGDHVAVAETLEQSSTGDFFEIATTKATRGGKEFSDWTGCVFVGNAGGALSEVGASNSSASATNSFRPAGRNSYTQRSGNQSNYPDSGERAKVQGLIVRQSSLGHAIEILKSRGVPFGTDEVTSLAYELVQWVYQENKDSGSE